MARIARMILSDDEEEEAFISNNEDQTTAPTSVTPSHAEGRKDELIISDSEESEPVRPSA
jgi:hypothetical protein